MRLYVKTWMTKVYETEDNDIDYIIKEFGDLDSYAEYQYHRGVMVEHSGETIMDYEVYGATDQEKEIIEQIRHDKMVEELEDVYNKEIAF